VDLFDTARDYTLQHTHTHTHTHTHPSVRITQVYMVILSRSATESESESELLYDWRFTPSQFSNSCDWPCLYHHLCTDRVESTVPLWQCNCCPGNVLVCGAVTYQRLLYSCLFRGSLASNGSTCHTIRTYGWKLEPRFRVQTVPVRLGFCLVTEFLTSVMLAKLVTLYIRSRGVSDPKITPKMTPL
jgi:hypothetical protein